MITATQIRMARAALFWSFDDLAKKTGLSKQGLINLANGKTSPQKNTSDKITKAFEEHGIEFIENGVREAPKGIEVIEGEDFYRRTLEKVTQTLAVTDSKELLIMFASDKVSPPPINDQYRLMRKMGIKMRQLIKEDDTYIMGPLEEYRTVPQEQFINIVCLVYDKCIAQVNGDNTAATIHRDPRLAAQKRTEFEYRWETGKQPEKSTAEEKF